jgi:ABC-2 type transport system permease protein
MVMINNLIQSPNGIFSLILSFLPLTSPVAMLTRMSVTHVPWWQILGSAVFLFLFSIWVIKTISVLFRGQVLLAGQPLTRSRFLKAFMGKVT